MFENLNNKAEKLLDIFFGKYFPLTLITILVIACLVFGWVTIITLVYNFELIFKK